MVPSGLPRTSDIYVGISYYNTKGVTSADFKDIVVIPAKSDHILPLVEGQVNIADKVNAKSLVLCRRDNILEMIEASIRDEAKKKVESWLSVLDMKLPEPAINIGLIKMIKDLPEYADYVVKGNYSSETTENYTIYAGSKDDIVILKDFNFPSTGLVINSAADDEGHGEEASGDDVDNNLKIYNLCHHPMML